MLSFKIIYTILYHLYYIIYPLLISEYLQILKSWRTLNVIKNCNLHGSCIQNIYGAANLEYVCNCDYSWTGELCDVRIDNDCSYQKEDGVGTTSRLYL